MITDSCSAALNKVWNQDLISIIMHVTNLSNRGLKYLSVFLAVGHFVYSSVCLSFCPSIHPSMHTCIQHAYIQTCIHTFIHTYIHNLGIQVCVYCSDDVYILSIWMVRLIQCPWNPLHLPALKPCSCNRHSLWGMQIYVALRLIIISIHTSCISYQSALPSLSPLPYLFLMPPHFQSISLVTGCLNVSLLYNAIHGLLQGVAPFVRHDSHSMARDVKGILISWPACSNYLPLGDYYCLSPGL